MWMAAEYPVKDQAATEISQLLYHLQVLMLALDLDLEDIYQRVCERAPRMRAVNSTLPGMEKPLIKVAVPNKGALVRARGRDAAGGWLRPALGWGTGAPRRGQWRRVLLPAPARHRRLRRRGNPRRRHHRPGHAARLQAHAIEVHAARLRPQQVPLRGSAGQQRCRWISYTIFGWRRPTQDWSSPILSDLGVSTRLIAAGWRGRNRHPARRGRCHRRCGRDRHDVAAGWVGIVRRSDLCTRKRS